MKILIVDNHSVNTKKLVHLFAGFDISVCDCDSFSPEKTENFDLVVLSGGSHVYAAENTKKAYDTEIDFIKTTKKPIIGICLSCQLIAKAFGGTLEKLEEKKHGIFEIKLGKKSYNVYKSHKYAIDKLPPQLELIAESETGPEIIKHKTKPVYGFQFHPEVFPRKTDRKKLFLSIVKELPISY